MKTPVCGLCGKEIHEGPVFIGRTLIDGGLLIEHQDCREAQDILDGLANVSKFVDAYTLARDEAAEGRAPAAEAELKEAKDRIAILEGELRTLRSKLADRRWRMSGEGLPGPGEVEIRATGWYKDGFWYVYLDGDIVESFPQYSHVMWWPIDSPMDSDDDPAASLRRGWEDVQEGRIHPVGELWDGIDEE